MSGLATPAPMSSQTALVTGCGAASGIGFAVAKRLAMKCAKVVITSTTDRIIERVADLQALPSTTAACECFIADLTDERQVRELAEFAGATDILVNNAGADTACARAA
eukprot:SAG31_NODE_3914_length_3756_cov_1.638228_2_plen_108_part_00